MQLFNKGVWIELFPQKYAHFIEGSNMLNFSENRYITLMLRLIHTIYMFSDMQSHLITFEFNFGGVIWSQYGF